MKKRASWNEREHVDRITLDWVKTNCRLTGREISLLQLVYDRKLVRRDHLEIISEQYRNTGDNRSILLNRAIRKMYRCMCLDKVHEKQEIGKGNSPCIVALDRAGSLLLNVSHRKRIAQRKVTHKGRTYVLRTLPLNYKHINGVNQIEVDTILSGNKIVQWRHEIGIKFLYGDEEILVISDVLMELKVKEKSLFIFLEYDTGSEDMGNRNTFPTIHDKLIKYRKYKNSQLWSENYPYFPIILLVTEDGNRIPYFNQKCKELGLQGFGVYHKNYVNFLRHLVNII